MTTYLFSKIINSDQLTHELTVFLAQINVEWNSNVSLISIDTVGEELTITLSDPLPNEQTESQLTELIDTHIPHIEVVSLSEYPGNLEALGSGLSVGDLYRTGEFVKIVF